MNENENNFESLRRLLALKRHETPPPGYFNTFSSRVISRIRAGESARPDNAMEGLAWLFRVLEKFQLKPAFAGTFASALCVLLVVGIVYAERSESTPQASVQAAVENDPSPALLASVSPNVLAQPADQPAGGIVSSTDPVLILQPVASTFGQQNPLAHPVSFSIPGN